MAMETSEFNNAIINFLKTLDINAFFDGNSVAINRTEMVRKINLGGEQPNYDFVMDALKTQFSDLYIMWSMRNDEYMTISVYTR